jgi:hypothetical protein
MICALSPADDNYEETLSTLVNLFIFSFIFRDMRIKLKKSNVMP